MSVHAKLLAAQQAIHAISKTGFNEHFRYAFFEEREVLQVARDALNNAGLAFFYSVEDATDREVETKNGRTEWITDVRMVCTIYDGETGEKLEGKAIGRGQDGQDKGINKAIVAGLKYWLLKVLMIPTDDDTEKNENTNKDGNARRVVPMQIPAKQSQPETSPTPSTPPAQRNARDAFSLDQVAPGKKAGGKTWRQLLENEEGRGFVQWALDKMTTLAPNARAELQAGMEAHKAGPVESVQLQDLLNRAAAVDAITIEQAARVEKVIDERDTDAMSAATDWLKTQIEKKRLGATV